jgi:hypothetical protein
MKKIAFPMSLIAMLVAAPFASPALAEGTPIPTAPEASPDSLSGSNVVFNPTATGALGYDQPGPQSICFDVNTSTTDWEWVGGVALKFPTSWRIEDAYGWSTTCANATWSGWSRIAKRNEVNLGLVVFHNPVESCTTTVCVSGYPKFAGDPATVSWFIYGDNFGSPPYTICSNNGYAPWSQVCDESVAPPAYVPYMPQ